MATIGLAAVIAGVVLMFLGVLSAPEDRRIKIASAVLVVAGVALQFAAR